MKSQYLVAVVLAAVCLAIAYARGGGSDSDGTSSGGDGTSGKRCRWAKPQVYYGESDNCTGSCENGGACIRINHSVAGYQCICNACVASVADPTVCAGKGCIDWDEKKVACGTQNCNCSAAAVTTTPLPV